MISSFLDRSTCFLSLCRQSTVRLHPSYGTMCPPPPTGKYMPTLCCHGGSVLTFFLSISYTKKPKSFHEALPSPVHDALCVGSHRPSPPIRFATPCLIMPMKYSLCRAFGHSRRSVLDNRPSVSIPLMALCAPLRPLASICPPSVATEASVLTFFLSISYTKKPKSFP